MKAAGVKADLLWPEAETLTALAAVAEGAGLSSASGVGPPTSADPDDFAAALGLEVQSTPFAHEPARRALRSAAPVLVPVDGGRVLAVVSAGRRRARVAVRGSRSVSVRMRDVAAAVSPAAGEEIAAAPPWSVVRASPGTNFWKQCRTAGLPLRLAGFVVAHAVGYGLFLWSWAVLGRAAFSGDVDGTALLRWALLLGATVPARVAATRLQARVAIAAGWLLRRRLLHGTLRLRPDEIRREGAGQLLGRALEAEAVEDLAIGGGLLGVLAVVEVAMAVLVLAAGPGLPLAGLLVVWVIATLAVARRYVGRRRRWAEERLGITHDLIEKMVGHRTRLVQQPPERWHDGEEGRLATYATLGRDMDRWLNGLLALAPRGWMVAAVAVLGLEISRGATPASVAVGAGGILLALSALTRLVSGLAQLADAAAAWSQVEPLFTAGASSLPPGGSTATNADGGGQGHALLVVEDLTYRYAGRAEAALAACSLRIERGDRLLLEGPSGSGKSTLTALLSGLRPPTAGRLRLDGMSQESIGAPVWRSRVTSSPQFHENHVLLGPLAFNLLIGRRWPPGPQDLQDAYELCVALGLGALLDRMPAGLQQMVGDTGWQLSHGERSLVFLARALLQRPDVVLLDETFGSLDPVTLQRALGVAVERAGTLLVIRQ